jgi:hypothetical protein
LRRIVSQVPSPVPRWGIEESAKISPAQAATGSQAEMREGATEGW